MAVIALTSAKGSPGVTATALALALSWPRAVMVAECDPAGGDVLAGYFAGAVEASRGLLGLAAAVRRGTATDELADQLIALATHGGRTVLPGITDPAQAAGLAHRWGPLGDLFAALETDGSEPVDVLVDCGRLDAAHPPIELLRRVDVVALVMRSTLVSVRSAYHRAARLRHELGTPGLGLALVGDRQPYPAGEIAQQLGLPLACVLAWDPAAASVLTDGGISPGRGFWCSPLMRSAKRSGGRLRELVDAHRRQLAEPRGQHLVHDGEVGHA
jgi:hypothetical protein